jgi:hypothetical protein
MGEPETLATMDLLREFGFQPDNTTAFSHDTLSFDFGSFKLEAAQVTNRWFKEVVRLYALLVTYSSSGQVSTLEDIDFELPCRLESRELCAAWIAWELGHRGPSSTPGPAWLVEGQQSLGLLPWRINQAAFEARPICTVQRDWLRLALKTLAVQIASVGDEVPVVVNFENGVLSVQCAGKKIALPAEGTSWPQQFTIPAGNLRQLPKRLAREEISVSVWDSGLRIT